MKEWLVLINPLAGRRGETEDRTRRALARYRIDAEIVTPQGEDEVARCVDEAAAARQERFVVVGGDGTINLVVGALMAQDWPKPPTLGILPAGTGSDYVRTFGISQRLEDAVAHLRGDRVYPSDVGLLHGRFGSRHFLNVAEAGLTAALVRRADNLPRRLGFARYHVALLLTYPRFRGAEIRLVAGRCSYQGPAMLVVFANAQFFGGGWNIAPKATVADGKFDIQVFAGTRRDVPRLWWRAKSGDHLTDPKIRRFSASRFTLETDPEWPVEADGEFFGNGLHSGEMVPAAINVKI